MTMQKSYCKQMRYSGPESLAPSDATKFDVLIQMEVLSGCEQGCLGCFVDKAIDPEVNQQIIDRAKELADGVKRVGGNLREFVIGPTDLFSAKNTKDILTNPTVQAIMREHTGARIASPAKFDKASMEKVREIFAILDDLDAYRRDMVIEFIMPVGRINEMLDDDEYYNSVMEKVEFFKNETPKMMDWSWTLQASNVVGKQIDKEKYNRMIRRSYNDYGTIVEMNPAFARAPNQIIQRNNLFAWNRFLESVIDDENSKEAVMSMANLYCNSINFVGITIVPGEHGPTTHLNVMLHEQAFFLSNKNLDVTGLSFEEILQRKNELITKGINRSSKVKDCSDCKFAIACANRLVFEAQESLNIDGCVLPKEILKHYNPFDFTWNDDASQYKMKDGA